MILSGYPSDTLRVSWDFFILKKKEKKNYNEHCQKKKCNVVKGGHYAFLENAQCCIMAFKKTVTPYM
jgi:hypothetical protein